MNNRYMFLTILFVLFVFITLGGLGNAAFTIDAFYWIPFVVNLGVYGWIIYKLIKRGQEE